MNRLMHVKWLSDETAVFMYMQLGLDEMGLWTE
jgi:hypothetical protein